MNGIEVRHMPTANLALDKRNDVLALYLRNLIETRRFQNVLEVSSDGNVDVLSGYTHAISEVPQDVLTQSARSLTTVWNVDLESESIDASDNFFDFVFSWRYLADCDDPIKVFNELVRVSPRGCLELPSPLSELLYLGDTAKLRGHLTSRHIYWTNSTTNTLYVIPKYTVVDAMDPAVVPLDREIHVVNSLIAMPGLWENFYMWDEDHLPAIVMLRLGSAYDDINTNGQSAYAELLRQGIDASIVSTVKLFEDTLNPFMKTIGAY